MVQQRWNNAKGGTTLHTLLFFYRNCNTATGENARHTFITTGVRGHREPAHKGRETERRQASGPRASHVKRVQVPLFIQSLCGDWVTDERI